MTYDNATTMGKVISAAQFREVRSRARLSNKQLAKLLEVSPSTISNWMRDGVVGRAEADVTDKLGMYLRDDSPNRPLSAYTDVELLAEVWQRMDAYKRASAETTPLGAMSQEGHSGESLRAMFPEAPTTRVRSGDAGERPSPKNRPNTTE